ncbi:Uncharacterised protein [Citrobacter freundii]|nr:Uncharacterised protein [Citrobacter freundii]
MPGSVALAGLQSMYAGPPSGIFRPAFSAPRRQSTLTARVTLSPALGNQPAALRTPVAAYPHGTNTPADDPPALLTARDEAVGKDLRTGNMTFFHVEMQLNAAPGETLVQKDAENAGA